MQAHYKISKRVTLVVEGNTQKELFFNLATARKWAETLGDHTCSICGCTETYPQTRTVEDTTFPEIVCANPECGAKLCVGQKKVGGEIFPRRALGKGDARKYLPNNGWDKTFARKPKSNDDEQTED